MKHISSISSGVMLGSAGIAMMSILTGCSQQQEQQNKFLVIEQLANGKYKVVVVNGEKVKVIPVKADFGYEEIHEICHAVENPMQMIVFTRFSVFRIF